MNSLALFALLISASAIALPVPSSYDCPFSKPDLPCTCTDLEPKPPGGRIDKARCNINDADVLPKFDTAKNQYEVNELDIIFLKNVKKVEPASFVAFKLIESLSFICEYANRTDVEFDQRAFESTVIKGLVMDYLKNSDSILEAIKTQKENLKFIISYQGNSIKFKADQFNGFQQLKDITIFDTPIEIFDKQAFVGLQNTLRELTLVNTSIDKFPTDQIKNLKQAQVFSLDENPINAIDLSDLNGLDQLLTFSASGMKSLKSVTISTLDKIPKSLRSVYLASSGITTLDSSWAGLLDLEQFEHFDVTMCSKLKCDEKVQWAAKYIFCGKKKLKSEAAICDNGRTLTKYLNETIPNPCA